MSQPAVKLSIGEKIKYFQAFIFYPPVLAIMSYKAMGRLGWQQGALAIALGLIAWMFIEYVMHRYLFHHPQSPGKWWNFMPWAHQTHHKHPRQIELILAPVWFSLPISGMIWLALRLLLGQWQLAVLILTGIWSAYLWYEFVHYTAHCRQPRNYLMRYLKTYHLLHHHTKEEIWFGVTTPLIDHLFGSYRNLPGRPGWKGDSSRTPQISKVRIIL